MPRLNIVKYTLRSLLLLTVILIMPVKTQAQSDIEPAVDTQPANGTPSASVFSIEGGEKLMEEADQAINNQEYDLAARKLQSARQVYNQLSNFYLQLYNSTSQLDNVAAESHRKKALETGVERDNATYQLALVHRSQNKSELSIPLLIQVINSQSPGIGLGKKAYDQLLEIGFVDVPITIPKAGSTPAPENPPAIPDAQPGTQPEGDAQPDAQPGVEIPSGVNPPGTVPGTDPFSNTQ